MLPTPWPPHLPYQHRWGRTNPYWSHCTIRPTGVLVLHTQYLYRLRFPPRPFRPWLFCAWIWCSIAVNSPRSTSQTANTSEYCVISRTDSSSNSLMCVGISEELSVLTCLTDASRIPTSVAGAAVAKGWPCRKKCALGVRFIRHNLSLVPDLLNDLDGLTTTRNSSKGSRIKLEFSLVILQ